MLLKLILLTLLHQSIFGLQYTCNQRSALLLLKKPAYEFSTRILDRVAQNTDAHFVFSPLSTWLQLTALAEGSTGKTFREIWKVTRHHRNRCFKLKLAKILNKLNRSLKYEMKRKSVMIIDELLAVNKKYIRDVQKFYKMKVLLKNFEYPETSAAEVNKLVSIGTSGVFNEVVYSDDFNSTLLLMSDTIYFRSSWKHPFNIAYTTIEPFFAEAGETLGEVNMMNQIGYFNMTELSFINAKILEIPCANGVSLLLFLPINDVWAGDLFFDMHRTKLTSIYNIFKSQGERLVNVKIPRFKIKTTVDNLAELVFDMGVRRIFDPDRSELDKISNFKLYASLLTQSADIEVTEKGVRASATTEFLVNDTEADKKEFIANKPFGFIIADRKTQFILFAGMYSKPILY